jgi:hypothetical protein
MLAAKRSIRNNSKIRQALTAKTSVKSVRRSLHKNDHAAPVSERASRGPLPLTADRYPECGRGFTGYPLGLPNVRKGFNFIMLLCLLGRCSGT